MTLHWFHRRLGQLAIGVSILLIAVLAFADTHSLLVRKARLKFGAHHSAKLDVRFSGLDVPEEFRGPAESVAVYVNDTLLARFEPDDGTLWSRRNLRRWKGKASGTAGCPGRAKFDLDTGSGRLKLSLRQIDHSDLIPADPDSCTVRLVLGVDEFTEKIDFVAKKNGWKYVNHTVTPKGKGGDGIIPGGGSGGDDEDVVNPGPDKILKHRLLTWATMPRGSNMPMHSVRVSSEADWVSCWSNDSWRFLAPTRPAVDFDKEMILTLAMFTGLYFQDVWFERKNGEVIGHVTIQQKICTGGICGRAELAGCWAVEKSAGPAKIVVEYTTGTKVYTRELKEWPVWPF
jgi:hypothetical protein